MKLINDFFHIISTETVDGGFRCRTRLNAGHDYYRVHFPGNPVTPGVCLLQMATEILSQEYNKKLIFRKGSNIKFKNLVAPNEEPEFVFTKTKFADGSLSTSVSVERGETQFVKMSLQYSVAD
ncbi:MAG: hypothetical protein IJK46_04410 [Prevotella sp.]|nr:hypothetical protein [Prevotella sp.]